ncbi:M48 family metallopeptidase [Nevskia ramosa]|uniref:M48 family metallopeptidase n=1 Tax=Nevskia ramosa TaxID=64002 RepID=UPI0023559B0F|nr:M48 family metallopeptidase [Nevskia ramosa]
MNRRPSHQKRRQKLLLSLLTATAVVACATSPLGRNQLKLYSDSDLDEMGVTAFAQTAKETPVTTNGQATTYVNCVANAITREVGGVWEVKVFESKDVNAFALPGGKIGVYTGLLQVAKGQDQLAAVIGHEVAHVIAGHSNERVSQQQVTGIGLNVAQLIVGGGAGGGALMSALGAGAQYGVLLPFSRAHESEADLLGLDYMAKAGFDPRQAVQLWQNMAQAGGQKPPEFASSHPSDDTRIRQIAARLPQDLPVYQSAQAAGKKPKCS